MEDGYKELIEKLHNIENVGDTPIGKHWSVLIDKSTLRDVIDVIERLVRERDAAIKDLKQFLDCDVCKNNNDECLNNGLCKECSVGKSTRKHWEWRGVQE